MKKIKILFLSSIIAMSVAFAEEPASQQQEVSFDQTKKNVITMPLLSMLLSAAGGVGELGVEYQRLLVNHLAIDIKPQFVYVITGENAGVFGGGAELGAICFFKKNSMKGLFISAMPGAYKFSNSKKLAFSMQGYFGGQFIINNKTALRLGLGGGVFTIGGVVEPKVSLLVDLGSAF